MPFKEERGAVACAADRERTINVVAKTENPGDWLRAGCEIFMGLAG